MNKDKDTEKTYQIDFECSNCGSVFQKSVPWGEPAHGKGGVCEYCGTDDHDLFSDGGFYCFRFRRGAISNWQRSRT